MKLKPLREMTIDELRHETHVEMRADCTTCGQNAPDRCLTSLGYRRPHAARFKAFEELSTRRRRKRVEHPA